jgi:predicted DNA-binding transcriptional regulator AlpA
MQYRRDQVHRPPAVASTISVSLSTLARWRSLHIGPAFVRLGPKSVGYLESDLVAWLDAQKRVGAPPTR